MDIQTLRAFELQTFAKDGLAFGQRLHVGEAELEDSDAANAVAFIREVGVSRVSYFG